MAPDAPTDERDPRSTPGAAAAAPAGTNAVVVYSDLRCPWAHVAVHRLLTEVELRGVASELHVDHRWFPLDRDAMPSDLDALDRKVQPIRELAPEAGWRAWAGSSARFPDSSELAAAWVQGAKRASPAASVALDRSLRTALFADGRDLADEAVLADIAAGVDGLDVETVRSEVASGRPAAELERHAELAQSDLVPASPTIVLADGTTWTNPGIEFHTEDGVPSVDRDDPDVYGEIVDAFLAQRHYD
jgi:predicted DsbA family dithiol-disulfide isomerase